MSVEFEKTVLQEQKITLNIPTLFDGYSKTTFSSPSISLNSPIISSSI